MVYSYFISSTFLLCKGEHCFDRRRREPRILCDRFLIMFQHNRTFLQAHAMLPHLGAGVGQGFEDVYTLSRLLTLARANKMDLKVSILPFMTHIN